MYDNSKARSEESLIRTEGIEKTFPGVEALADVSFSLFPGEIHSVVGENGAGKSTFIKILSGALEPDSGTIYMDGQKFPHLDPHQSQDLGIQVIYQENILVPSMNVAENIFVGHEKTGRFGFISYNRAMEEARDLIESLGIDLDPTVKVEELGVVAKQFVKVLKALALESKVLIMDEPVAALPPEDTEKILNLVKELKQNGISVIYISHKLEDVLEISDRITVLKDGEVVNVHDVDAEEIDEDLISREMVGRPIDKFYKKEEIEIGDILFQVKGLMKDEDSPAVDLEVREGEILAIAGLANAGRTELVRTIFGAEDYEKGEFEYQGNRVKILSPRDAIATGLGLIPEDRRVSGLASGLSVKENVTIADLDKLGDVFLDMGREEDFVQEHVDRLEIKTPSLEQEVRFLSGGNQQKVVLARWLFADVDVLIFDEPTRGIDVNTKAEIYKIMQGLAKKGKAIIMVSSEMPELISMSDRILVMKEGSIVAELTGEEITEEEIISNAV
ncbi:MAG: sugar ABC transporter ATP-binding protein [Candidatus Bipolaricaulota bacterium]|nr:sugar ABC transporter ATP-binding protein [Candidatus Bipolaricaulota bacterium]MBS3791581.1 sugar ABC transporter ATP-binding protein [Candidatus Bipolaricaulota bacterium]